MQNLTIAIIFSYESTQQLKACVDSVAREIPKIAKLVGSVDWVLVRTPKARGKDLSFFAGKILDSITENLGVNRSLAMKSAQSEGFYFIDPDCILESGSLEVLCQAFEKEKSNSKIFGFAGPNVLVSENLNLNRVFKWLGKMHFLNGNLSQVSVSDENRLDWHSPTCHILYNLTYLRGELFSSQFSRVGEDLEFHFRQSQKAHRILICSESRVLHWQQPELKVFLKKIFRYGSAQTQLLKAQPHSIRNKRLLVLGTSLFWASLLPFMEPAQVFAYLALTVILVLSALFYEFFNYKEEKNFLSFSSFFLLVAGTYLLGQVSGLLIPLPKQQSE